VTAMSVASISGCHFSSSLTSRSISVSVLMAVLR
jgi:hypothetical protein